MNTNISPKIPYPRFQIRRSILNHLSRALLRLFSKLRVSGLENIPKEGPVILAGNHVSTLEPMLMATFPKRLVELLGAGDIPFEGFVDNLVNFYGFIAVNRGNIDREAMNQALAVLKQGGVLGIYPEGGTWKPGQMKAQVGVAWLSSKGQAVVVPIGFSGFKDSFSKLMNFKRPRLEMKVGQPIPALAIHESDKPIKEIYQDYADMVLERIRALVDPKEFLEVPERSEYSLQVLTGKEGETFQEVDLTGSDALAEFFFSPVLLNSFISNLKKPIESLYPNEQERSNQFFSDALQSVIEVLKDNPGFFTYRMGIERGHKIEKAIQALIEILDHAEGADQSVILKARALFRYPDGRVEEKAHDYDIYPG